MESIKELKEIVEKGVERHRFGAMYFIEPIQVYVTKILLLLGLNRIAVSVLWLAIGIISACLFLTGQLYLGLVAIGLHYLQTILDGCDGQVAKYNKQKLSEERDARLWSIGLYMDYFQHIIIDTLSMGFFSIGIYFISNHTSVLIAGIFLIYIRMYKRTNPSFILKTANSLRKKKHILEKIAEYRKPRWEKSLVIRLLDSLAHLIFNGKKLYFLLLISHLMDLTIPSISVLKTELIYRELFIYFAVLFGLFGVLVKTILALKHGKLIADMKGLWT